LAGLVNEFDLGLLEKRDLNRRALIIRSTADEAASGLAAAQLLGRIASDVPALVWKLPRGAWTRLRRWSRLDGVEPPGWAFWGFWLLMLAVALGLFVRGAAWLSQWPLLRQIDVQVRALGSSATEVLVSALVWVAVGVMLVLLSTVPLIIVGLPLKLAGLLLYGLRGWPLFQALYIELSVEPAPPGEWRVHQLDSKDYASEVARAREQCLQQDLAARVRHDSADIEGAARAIVSYIRESESEPHGETTLAHSFVYNDPRAHRAIEEWLHSLAGRVSLT
jgi:hypothetical protein